MKTKALSLALMAGILGGVASVIIKYLDLSPFVVAAMRTGFPAAVLYVYFHAAGKPIKHRLNLNTILASGLSAVHVLLWVVGFQLATLGNAVVAGYTWPIFAFLAEALILKAKLTLKQGLLTILAFTGVVFTVIGREFSFGNADVVGSLMLVLSAVAIALSFVLFKKEGDKHTPLEKVYYQNLAGSLVFLPFLLFSSPFPSPYQLVLGFAHGMTVLAIFGLAFYAMKRLSASVVSSAMYIEVVSTIMLGALIFGEEVTRNVVVGACLITLAGLWLRRLVDQRS